MDLFNPERISNTQTTIDQQSIVHILGIQGLSICQNRRRHDHRIINA